jgi:hypothetical protein
VTSYEKLTDEGMTYDATALVDLVEAALPARFGGGPADYQVLEEEDADGLTRLTLIVSPRLGPLDEAALLWGQAGLLRVRREEPRPTLRGKVLPFQVDRRPGQIATPTPPERERS